MLSAIRILPYLVLTLALVGMAKSHAQEHQTMVMSVVEHPAIQNKYLPVVLAMYKQAGLQVKPVLVSKSERSLIGLQDGLFDADVGKILEAISGFENILYVPTPISNTSLFLICRRGKACDASVLSRKDIVIASPYNRETLLKVVNVDARITTLTSNMRVRKMLDLDRVDFVLLGNDAEATLEQLHEHYQVVALASSSLYHLVNSKHADLVPRLDAALKKVLDLPPANTGEE